MRYVVIGKKTEPRFRSLKKAVKFCKDINKNAGFKFCSVFDTFTGKLYWC